MSKAIDSVVEHFTNQGIRKYEVEELSLTVYAKPTSLGLRSKISKHADGDAFLNVVYTVIFGALDAEGNQLFDIGDKVKLRDHSDPLVISKIANFILGNTSIDEDREKN